jgi:hypothetical protein
MQSQGDLVDCYPLIWLQVCTMAVDPPLDFWPKYSVSTLHSLFGCSSLLLHNTCTERVVSLSAVARGSMLAYGTANPYSIPQILFFYFVSMFIMAMGTIMQNWSQIIR